MSQPKNVLFLCTGNSARSILAEAILNCEGEGRFRAYSAGSHPKRAPHPMALRILETLGHDIAFARSKSWDEFAAAGAPEMDFVITVCDNAAGEVCPIWPGNPATAHWGVPDPAALDGSEAELHTAFGEAYKMLDRHIRLFLSLPIETLDRMGLSRKLREIGETRDGEGA
jgi:protein-tyrosine-phosphatase